MLLPALYYAKQDRDRGLLSEDDAQFVGQATREILDVLAHDAPVSSVRDSGNLSVNDPGDTPVRILGCPARDEADAVALEMVRHLLDPARYRIEVSGTGMLTAEVVARVDLDRPGLLCIDGAVAPDSTSASRPTKRVRPWSAAACNRVRAVPAPVSSKISIGSARPFTGMGPSDRTSM